MGYRRISKGKDDGGSYGSNIHPMCTGGGILKSSKPSYLLVIDVLLLVIDVVSLVIDKQLM